jgi:hypothetical protein
VDAKEVEHGDYPDLDAAVAAADQRKVGDRWALGSSFNGLETERAVGVSTMRRRLVTRGGPLVADPGPAGELQGHVVDDSDHSGDHR